MKGKFIVIYGANNLGKTTQMNLLEEFFRKRNVRYKRIKYPIYNLEPTGPILNNILRNPDITKKYTELQIQEIFVQNRQDYEPTLVKDLNDGFTIIAEDYIGTGIAWGVVNGITLEKMISLNKSLLTPDIAILLDGERFKDKSIEMNHKNESAGDEVWNKSRAIHRQLANMFGWNIVNANSPIEEVHKTIIQQLNTNGLSFDEKNSIKYTLRKRSSKSYLEKI